MRIVILNKCVSQCQQKLVKDVTVQNWSMLGTG